MLWAPAAAPAAAAGSTCAGAPAHVPYIEPFQVEDTAMSKVCKKNRCQCLHSLQVQVAGAVEVVPVVPAVGVRQS